MRTDDGHQPEMRHDTPEDALRSVVEALGGPNRVALELWPALSMAEGNRLLLNALDRDRREKLDLAELDHLGRLAREDGCHVLMAYFARSWDYEMPLTMDPEDEDEQLKHEFTRSVQAQERVVKRLERLERSRRDRELRELQKRVTPLYAPQPEDVHSDG